MGRVRANRNGARSLVLLAVALYALAVAVSPVLHHDFACHRVSPTHCTACDANPAAFPTETAATLDTARMPVAGTVETLQEQAHRVGASLRVPARAPPA